ncbi:MAG: phosphoribosylformylglycinamidine synthase, partial [Acutalibacteraceae bacterium]|nr:phosphoribosylformylglycinamidine synthase [Acutalibacteraceae bacterium]
MVYRVYVEKKEALANEAKALKNDIVSLLQIKGLKNLRLLNRYDVENIEKELYDYAVKTVFSEPQLDIVTEEVENTEGAVVFATEYLPGQFDQRADSAAQCIQIISQGDRPLVKTAKVYVLYGDLTEADVEAIKKYVINPVESREASLDMPETLVSVYDIPTEVATLDGFLELDEQGLADFVKKYGLAMDNDDIKFCQDYFKSEHRDPTITEIRMIDTYWSDHCRHTTFLTTIDEAEFEDKTIHAAFEEYMAVREKLGR